MGSLSTVEARLPPGFRFHPRDDELICEYLIKLVNGCPHPFPSLIEVDLNKCEPWEIPESACVGGKDWYFYSQRDRKYATGLRTNRATVSGYWKATGKDRPITRKGALVGMRKTLVFYQGRAPKGRKTDWVMHEFRIDGPGPMSTPPVKEDWVLCRMFFKSRAEVNNPSEARNGRHVAPCSQSLPPLMEPYITFEQCEVASDDPEQVPCFSIFNPFTTFSHMDPPPTMSMPMPMPTLGGGYSSNSTIKAVLSELTRMENNFNIIKGSGSSPSLGEGSSDCSYLSEVGPLWNHHYSS